MNDAASTAMRDANHLRLLSIFHYVFAGLSLLGIGLLLLHYGLMRTVIHSAEFQQAPNPPPQGFLDLFIWFYLLMGLFIVAYAVLNLMAGRYLRQRRHRMFCMVVAALNCLQVPLGVVLGVFTLVTLARESVRLEFEAGQAAAGPG